MKSRLAYLKNKIDGMAKLQKEEAEITEALRVLERYGNTKRTETPRSVSRPSKRKEIADAAVAILHESQPMRTGKILEILTEKGYVVGGENKEYNLSNILSAHKADKGLQVDRKLGWSLVKVEFSPSDDADTASEGDYNRNSLPTKADGQSALEAPTYGR